MVSLAIVSAERIAIQSFSDKLIDLDPASNNIAFRDN